MWGRGHGMGTRSLILASVGAVGLLVGTGALGCRLLLGNLNECNTTSDCVSYGAGIVCQNNLCVTDPRCVTFGNFAPGSLLIGAILPKTNSDGTGVDQAGVLSEDAIRLVAQQINQSGGESVRPLAVISCDDTYDGPTAENLAQELVDQGVVAIVTDGSTVTTAASQVTIPAGVLLVAAWATSIQIGSLGVSPSGGPKLVWSTAVPDSVQGKVMADLLASNHVQFPAIIARNDLYGTGLTDSISSAYKLDTDGGATASALFPPGGDPSAAVTQIESQSADAIVIVGLPTEADSVLADWTKQDPKTWYFTDVCESPQTIADLPDGVARLVGHSLGTGPGVEEGTQAYSDFASQFETAFGQDPATQSFVPNTYDAAMLIVVGAAWAQANGVVNGTQIAAGLSHIEAPLPDGGTKIPLEPSYLPTISAAFVGNMDVNLQGASGPLDFDPATGVAPGPIATWTFLEDGGIGTLSTINP